MPGSFHGINLASSALRAFQRAMETSGHNLANVNTRGYSRQRVEMEAMDPVAFWNGSPNALGSGVRIENITRAREMFLEARYHTSNGEYSRFSQYAGGLTQIESTFREPGESGIGHAMDKMFDAFSGLASNPSDPNAKTRVRDAASLFASRVRTAHSDLGVLREQTAANVQTTIGQINQIASQLATLNGQIRAAHVSGGAPNDLLDQRDTLIRDLSMLANVSTTQQADGTFNVNVSNFPLVNGEFTREFPTTIDPTTMTISDGTINYPVRGGTLLGQLQTMNRIDQSRAELDTLANTMRAQFNAIHQTGINGLGQTGVNFFNDVTPPALPTGAIDFDLNPAIKSDPAAIATGTTNAAGDGGLALMLSQLRDTKLAGLGTKTFQQFYAGNVASLASEISQSEAQTNTFGSILDQITAQADSISGVNMDEEMSDLMRFQRSYQAAARLLQIMDQATEDVINMVRR